MKMLKDTIFKTQLCNYYSHMYCNVCIPFLPILETNCPKHISVMYFLKDYFPNVQFTKRQLPRG